MTTEEVKRGMIFYADLGQGSGSEQSGLRPVLVFQNDLGNKHSKTTIVLSITSAKRDATFPVHHHISAKDSGLDKDSIILCEQIRTIDKARLRSSLVTLSPATMDLVSQKVMVSLGMAAPVSKNAPKPERMLEVVRKKRPIHKNHQLKA